MLMRFPWHQKLLSRSGKLPLPCMLRLCTGDLQSAQRSEGIEAQRSEGSEGIEVVSHVKYLGSVFTSDCTLDAEITHRVAAASSAFQQLRRANTWSSRALTLSVAMQIFQCIVMSVLLYFAETWAVVKQHISPLAAFQMNCLRRICGISCICGIFFVIMC